LKKVLYIVLVFFLFSLVGCKGPTLVENNISVNSDKIQVYTSFYPLYFAVQEIAQNKVDVYSIIPNGVEPHDYEPTIKQMIKVENADLFIYNGAGMEPWGDKISDTLKEKNIPVINASEHVELREIGIHNHHHEDNLNEEGHFHEAYDPHIWLNPINMDKIGMSIMEQLCIIDPDNLAFYKENYEDFSMKLKEIDKQYTNDLKKRNKSSFLVSHDAFGYLADRYGLEQISVLGITPNEEPTSKTLKNLINLVNEGKFRYIFLEVLASPQTVEMLAEEANIEILVLNPISGLTEEQQRNGDNYYTIMKENLENLKKELVR